MKNKLLHLIVIILVIITTPACWDIKDISDRSYILAIGIDKADNMTLGQDNIPFRYKLTAEISKPALINPLSWNLEPEKRASIVLSAEGETIEKAFLTIQSAISRRLILSDLQVLLVGEDMADEIKEISSFFEKNTKIAHWIRLMSVRDHKASDVLKTTPKLERTIAKELLEMTELNKELSYGTFKPFTRFLSEMRANNGQSLGGAVNLLGNEFLMRSGSAVYDDWKLVGWLDAEETRKSNFLFPESKNNTVIGQLNEGIYTYRIDKKKTKITPKLQNGNLSFTVKIKTDGILTQEENKDLNLTEPENITKLENLFTQVIDKEVNEAIDKSQKEFKVDYFNFGMTFMDKEPDYFESLDWKETYPTVPIETEIEVKVTRFGLAK